MEVFPIPTDGDVVRAAVTKAIVPGANQQDNRLEMPSARLIKVSEEDHDGQVGNNRTW